MAKEREKNGRGETGYHGVISGGTGSGDNKMAGSRMPAGAGTGEARKHGKMSNAR
jgi:hypothetical protein